MSFSCWSTSNLEDPTSKPYPNPNPNPNPNLNPNSNPNPNPNCNIRMVTIWKVMGHARWLLQLLTSGVRQSRFYPSCLLIGQEQCQLFVFYLFITLRAFQSTSRNLGVQLEGSTILKTWNSTCHIYKNTQK